MPIAREKVPSADPPSPQAIEVPATNRLRLNRQQLALLRIEFPHADSRANSDRSLHFFRAPRRLPASSGAQEIQGQPVRPVKLFHGMAAAGARFRFLQQAINRRPLAARDSRRVPDTAARRGPCACAGSDLRRRKEKRLAEWAAISSNLVFLAFTSFAAL